MRILFVGDTWNGSSARSLRDGLANIDSVDLDDIGEDHYKPRGTGLIIRAVNRVLKPIYKRELSAEILKRCKNVSPDVVLVYKGSIVDANTISEVKKLGVNIINVYPDCSPHAFGRSLRKAMGLYDLVISTKPFHPVCWKDVYGYDNECVCVPHGYDPKVHYWSDDPSSQDIDVVVAASWLPQYEKLMVEVGRLIPDTDISFAIAGSGWREHRYDLPAHWQFPGPIFGRAYGEFTRRGKIVIAPVHTDVVISGRKQPGDQDTTRTYELAAAGSFFLHRRTPFVKEVYKEGEECEFWDDAKELAEKIRHYLPREDDRRRMALAAHKRAVPAYSVPARAREVLRHIKTVVKGDSSR